MRLLVYLILSGAGTVHAMDIPPDTTAQKFSLLNRQRALEMEIDLVRKDPQQFYLVLDLPAAEIYLKSGTYLLRTIPIRNSRLSVPVQAQETALLKFTAHIPPVTPEPGNPGKRLGGRHFPLDFAGRMLEGPRDVSRLYFMPSFLLHTEEIASPPDVQALILSRADIKALGSALQTGDKAILIPSSTAPGEVTR